METFIKYIYPNCTVRAFNYIDTFCMLAEVLTQICGVRFGGGGGGLGFNVLLFGFEFFIFPICILKIIKLGIYFNEPIVSI